MRATSSARRRGFTLMEMLLVLALVVAIAAMALPNVATMFQTQRLRGAADTVRSQWIQCRNRAMRTGITHAFVFEPDAGAYRIEPWLDVGDEIDSIDPVSGAPGEPPPIFEEELPEGIVFVASEVLADVRSMLAEQSAGSGGGLGSVSQSILFYADGTTSTAQVVLKTERDLAISLDLRGLTGASRVSEVFNLGEGAP